jgi:hypothetical protein
VIAPLNMMTATTATVADFPFVHTIGCSSPAEFNLSS